MIQKLNDSKIPPTHIMQLLSGHKNVQSITNHGSLNLNQQQQQKNISGILNLASSQTQVTTETATNETAAASTSNELISPPLLQISSALR